MQKESVRKVPSQLRKIYSIWKAALRPERFEDSTIVLLRVFGKHFRPKWNWEGQFTWNNLNTNCFRKDYDERIFDETESFVFQ